MQFTYPCRITPASDWADGETGFVVLFPDWNDAATQGETEAEAQARAGDLLATLLGDAIDRKLEIPEPSAGQCRVAPPIDIALKAAVYVAMRAKGWSKSELARRMDVDEREVRRLLDPDVGSRVSTLRAALAALDARVDVAVAA
jgi:antitoxin HicB